MELKTADRNLLFGIMALQMDFVSHDDLMAAFNGWVQAKQRPLAEILVENSCVTREERDLLEGLVSKHIKRHGNDPSQSLAAIRTPRGILDELKKFPDTEVQASIRRVQPSSAAAVQAPADPYVTKVTSDAPTEHEAPADPYATNASAVAVPGSPRISIGASTSAGLRFRVLRPFARGGLGEVLVAEDQELHREVALKQIQERFADDVESRHRFVQEAEITGALEHPGIVPVYGLGQYADGRPYYAMRFIRGDSLNDAIERFHKEDGPTRDPGERALALRQLLDRFVDVCQAIAYAHSRGILHRDLKPGNIMLGKYGETLVVDWGLAKPIGQSEKVKEATGEHQVAPTMTGTATVMGSAVGTPQFMSPEQAAGNLDRLGPASDVYSLGATLYQLLTGEAPIPDRDVNVVLQRVRRGDVPRPRQVKPSVPVALEAICMKAMALKPEERYSSPRLLADDIERWKADEPVSAYQEPWWMKARRWLRRHRTLATTAASVALVTIIGLTISNVLLTAANERERRAKTIAERNFQYAKSSVDQYQTRVSEEMLLQEPGMEPLRARLLRDASEFYAKFVQERRDDPALKGELARAKYRLGLITGDIEAEGKAIELLEEAAPVFAEEGERYQRDLALCYYQLGRLYRKTEQADKSAHMYQLAHTVWESLAAQTIENIPGLARTENGIGNVLQVNRRFEDARQEYAKALANWAKLPPDEANKPEYLRDQGNVHTNLGLVASMAGKTEQAREELIKAIALQEKLAKENPNLGKVQDDLARSHYLLGDVHRANLGDPQREVKEKTKDKELALAEYEEAVRIWRELVQFHPTVRDYRLRLLDALGRQADMLRADRKLQQAIAVAKEVLDVQLKLAAADPDAPQSRGDVARRRFQLANMLRDAGESAQAETAYQDALKAQRQLAGELPDVPHYQADVARTREGLGRLRLNQRQADRAEAELGQALEIWIRLQQLYPEEIEFAKGLAATCINLRSVTRIPGNHKIPLEPLNRAVGVYDKPGALPKVPEMRQALYQCRWTRAEARTTHGQYAEALQDWDEAMALAPSADGPWLKLSKAITLARYGQPEEATKSVNDMAKATKSGEALYQIARVYAWSAQVEAKKNGPETNAAQAYAARALELLQQARGLGYFQFPESRQHLLDDADWQSLRDQSAFRTFLAELNKK